MHGCEAGAARYYNVETTKGAPDPGRSHAANAELERAFDREITGSASDKSRSHKNPARKNKPIPGWPEIRAHLVSFNLRSNLICKDVSSARLAAAAFGAIDAENA
jgi:hypothetical protein